MEITKTIKATQKEIELLMSVSDNLNLKSFERKEGGIIDDFQYENEPFNFKCTFRMSDELADEVKKARGFNAIWKLYKEFNQNAIKEYVETQIKKYEEEIKKLKEL